MERHGETWREMRDERVCRLGDSARLALWVCRCPDPGWSMSVLVCPTGYAETFKVDGKARMPCCEGRRIRKDTERERASTNTTLLSLSQFSRCETEDHSHPQWVWIVLSSDWDMSFLKAGSLIVLAMELLWVRQALDLSWLIQTICDNPE